jgi:transcriptional regulator with XRE-family HTH domain
MQLINKTIAANIRASRLAAGLTKAEAARAVGMHPSAYASLEEGNRGYMVSTLQAVAYALGVTIQSLFNEAKG